MPHAYRPAGTSPLVAVQLYLPPGPEQRFKKLAVVEVEVAVNVSEYSCQSSIGASQR